jgi:ubiquitin-protein ligase
MTSKSSQKNMKIISKETINRLVKDVKHLIKNPLTDNNIFYSHDEDDVLKGYALIIGPLDTPYFGGYYFFELNYPENYPYSPPTVLYKTNGDKIRFNPNLYTNEKVCISLLNTWRGEQWTSCQTISTILLTLCTLLCKDPLLNEPGINREHVDFLNYTRIIEYKNIDIAILKIVNKTPEIYNKDFDKFYPIVEENYKKNYDKIVSFVDNKIIEYPEVKTYNTSLYSMNVVVNYKELRDKLVPHPLPLLEKVEQKL